MAREILGHIDCPHCGLVGGMRISLDKSGAPFGYCEGECSGQMRVGGSAYRVAKFYANYPHLVQSENKPVTVSAPEQVQTPEPKKAPSPKKLSIFDQLAGVTHG